MTQTQTFRATLEEVRGKDERQATVRSDTVNRILDEGLFERVEPTNGGDPSLLQPDSFDRHFIREGEPDVIVTRVGAHWFRVVLGSEVEFELR